MILRFSLAVPCCRAWEIVVAGFMRGYDLIALPKVGAWCGRGNAGQRGEGLRPPPITYDFFAVGACLAMIKL